jgi:BlaI family transcriptional regulator, penicillinase repressor
MASPSLKISDAEWTVMRSLWKLGEGTAAEVSATLAAGTTWSPRTVRTLLGRLVKKEVLGYREVGREYLYRPLVDEQTCEREASLHFLDKIFSGQLSPFLAHFAESGRLSAADLAELSQIVSKTTPES